MEAPVGIVDGVLFFFKLMGLDEAMFDSNLRGVLLRLVQLCRGVGWRECRDSHRVPSYRLQCHLGEERAIDATGKRNKRPSHACYELCEILILFI